MSRNCDDLDSAKKTAGRGASRWLGKDRTMITGAGVKSADNFQLVSLPTISANEVLKS